ncbi:phosphotransferase [Streptomyces sp. P17]|uniref:phosphotransferase n=1 Tax=Streptomyces sp. P17 TaxID=3074716 RepID=UPI0028F4367A|nr:phosphotransferase [Streptomyces sp. P17]MDT9698062.1 phosphotransferase [Streptomyces sp. P17]
MRPDELDIDAEPVRRLIAEQFPQWAGRPVRPVRSAGTDNAMYRLGDDLVARLPRLPGGQGQIIREHRWLPRPAPHLPLPVPVPLAVGEPGAGFARPRGVYRWLDGSNGLVELADVAVELGRFVAALHMRSAPTPGGGTPGVPEGRRGPAWGRRGPP